jgi:hypothetical protein
VKYKPPPGSKTQSFLSSRKHLPMLFFACMQPYYVLVLDSSIVARLPAVNQQESCGSVNIPFAVPG